MEVAKDVLPKLMMGRTELAKGIEEIKRAWGPQLDKDKDKNKDRDKDKDKNAKGLGEDKRIRV